MTKKIVRLLFFILIVFSIFISYRNATLPKIMDGNNIKIDDNESEYTKTPLDEVHSLQNEKLYISKTLQRVCPPVVQFRERIVLTNKGDDVKEIQKKLNKFGYNIELTGFFGQATLDAVLNFQFRLGMSPDGIVGPETLKELNKFATEETKLKTLTRSDIGDEISPDYIKSAEEYITKKNIESKTNYIIWINTRNQNVNIFSSVNKHWQLIKTFSCASGCSSSPTVKGLYSVRAKGYYFRVSSNIICKYFTAFYGDYCLHTVLLNNKGQVVNGTLGRAISHGCVRLAIDNAKFIFFNIPMGTPVYVV
ncbi:hypothetical protein SH2C18_22350 [Clostridium sediminicola]|uniref:L,D-transpeptidase family protein n=1 Tax=Clostridium sediminicola TaxID=3114879 RepID=UPI0031F20175